MYSVSKIDINECTLDDPCDVNADCDNTDGSFDCTCRLGYMGNGLSCQGNLYGMLSFSNSQVLLLVSFSNTSTHFLEYK